MKGPLIREADSDCLPCLVYQAEVHGENQQVLCLGFTAVCLSFYVLCISVDVFYCPELLVMLVRREPDLRREVSASCPDVMNRQQ